MLALKTTGHGSTCQTKLVYNVIGFYWEHQATTEKVEGHETEGRHRPCECQSTTKTDFNHPAPQPPSHRRRMPPDAPPSPSGEPADASPLRFGSSVGLRFFG